MIEAGTETAPVEESSFDCAAMMPKPQKEHDWFQQFVGEWESDSECTMEPGKPPMKSSWTENCRMIGGFWMQSEGNGEMMGSPFTSVLTLGFNPDDEQFVGTFIFGGCYFLWQYKGSLNAEGNTLTLETEGPCPMSQGKVTRFTEVIEFKDKDHRTFTSTAHGEDGSRTTVMKIESRRKA